MTWLQARSALGFRALALVLVGALGSSFVPAPAHAEDPAEAATPSFDDIVAMLKDKNAQFKQDKLQQAVAASAHPWRPKDIYALVDLGASPAITSIAAGKAKMFWDGSAKSLAVVQKTGRDAAPAETVKIGNNADLVMIFEHFNDIKYGLDAAKNQVGTLQPRQGYEDDVKYDMRKRDYDLRLAAALAPFEGQIAKSTFEAELTGSFTPHDGSCTRAQVVVDLSKVNFELFRYTMGGLKVDVPFELSAGSNVETAKWSASGQYRFEATSAPLCVSAAQAATLSSQGSKLKITMSRPFDSDRWTATATFHNAKTGAKL